jgi:hypothetical protein
MRRTMTKPVDCPDPETFEQLFSGVDLPLDSGALATTPGVTVSTPTSVRVRSLVDLRAWRARHGPPSP